MKKGIEDYVRRRIESATNADGDESAVVKRSFADAVAHAITARRQSGAGFGATAERLAGAGLSHSGYAAHLERRAGRKLSESLTTAEADKLTASATQRLEEEKLEAALREKTNSLKNKVLYYALAEGITDYDVLFNYATDAGLSEADARTAADGAFSAVKESVRKKAFAKVQSTIISKRLTSNQAYEYALSLELDESDARELAKLAYKMNESVGERERSTGQGAGSSRLHLRD